MNLAGSTSGVRSILRYNIGFYAASLCVLIAIGATLRVWKPPALVFAALLAAAFVTSFWTLSSLLVSYHIYDYAAVTRWRWLPSAMPSAPRRWLSIHAGLDESSAALEGFFPGANSLVMDIYDPAEMTEASIARARLSNPALRPAIAARLDALPLPDADRDAVFLLFAAHEIRSSERRTLFFRQIARVLTPTGQVVLVEHLRDWPNFIAFGPGFLHFMPRREWLRLARAAGLAVEREQAVTPFVRCFVLRKGDA